MVGVIVISIWGKVRGWGGGDGGYSGSKVFFFGGGGGEGGGGVHAPKGTGALGD